MVAASACCFGSISILTVLGTARGTSLATLMIGRYAIAFVILAAILARTGRLRISGRVVLWLILFFGSGQAAVAYLSLAALEYIPAATMSFLFYTFPATVAIISALTGLERLTPRRLGALALSLTGVVVMVGAPWALEANVRGVLLALASGTVYAIYVVGLSRLPREVPATVATLYIVLGAGTIFIAAGVATDTITWNPHPAAIAVMFAIAIFSTVLAFAGFLRGISVLGSVRTSIISTVEPFWTALMAAAVLSQPITPGTLGGGALIAAAVILLQLKRY
jgi:drug/metabolite transporter (DMT)-like permease